MFGGTPPGPPDDSPVFAFASRSGVYEIAIGDNDPEVLSREEFCSRLQQVSGPVHCWNSHTWPPGCTGIGDKLVDVGYLIQRQRHFPVRLRQLTALHDNPAQCSAAVRAAYQDLWSFGIVRWVNSSGIRSKMLPYLDPWYHNVRQCPEFDVPDWISSPVSPLPQHLPA